MVEALCFRRTNLSFFVEKTNVFRKLCKKKTTEDFVN